MGALWSEWERAAVERTLRQSVVGGPDTVERGLTRLIEQTGADELMITSHIFDHQARLRSYEIVAAIGGLAGVSTPPAFAMT